MKRPSRLQHLHVRDADVTDRAVADPDTHAIGLHPAHNVRDAYVLAGLSGIPEPRRIAAYGDCIVAGLDIAVADAHVAAAVDIEPVGVEIQKSIAHLHAAHDNAVATVEKATPAAHVLEHHVTHRHIPAFDEDDLLPRTALFGRLTPRIASAMPPTDL